ncbi:unnamed protein product [Thelazia callipaeda]|uniref:Odorant receptor n=1 Tax=Thelazia callipaeda TaxID=103827 RepID=A0A0N5CP33_THECL|nr:unnamed protein product [Thelazia callipaeda]
MERENDLFTVEKRRSSSESISKKTIVESSSTQKSSSQQEQTSNVESKTAQSSLSNTDTNKTLSDLFDSKSEHLPDFVFRQPSALFEKVEVPQEPKFYSSKEDINNLNIETGITKGKSFSHSLAGINDKKQLFREVQPLKQIIPLNNTCRLMPYWWSDHPSFVEKIIKSTRYFHVLNESFSQNGKRLMLFENAEIHKLLQPFYGNLFVIFGCIVLAFPILLLLMFLRCISEEDLMEEAMFDVVEISIFCVFSVVEFYMSSGVELRAAMNRLCIEYLDHSIRMNGLLNAEQMESRKYLHMAVCLHYGKPLRYMTNSARESIYDECSVE